MLSAVCPGVIVFQGYIKFFEMNRVRRGSDSEKSWIIEKCWVVAATKKLKISSIGSSSSNNNWDWEEDCAIKCSDEVPVDSTVYAQMLLPEVQGEGCDTKQTLKIIQAGYPATI